MINALREDMLGPRHGPEEVLTDSPRFEYITGILEPLDYTRSPLQTHVEAVDVKPIETRHGEEDEEFDEDILIPSPVGSAIDPRAYAKSLGISFIVSGNNPTLSICVTYGTYRKIDKSYQRTPHFFIVDKHHLSQGRQVLHENESVKLTCYVKTKSGKLHTSLYLINKRIVDPSYGYPEIRDYVFQPQIRVICEGNTKTEHVEATKSFHEDEKNFNLLFRKKQAFARGHMCSAMWHDVDPERSSEDVEQGSPPFSWCDGQQLSKEVRENFTAPSVRSEYLPISLVEQVEMSVSSPQKIKISASKLSEAWDYEECKKQLEPLVSEYEKWIELRKIEYKKLDKKQAEIALTNIQNCEEALTRMKSALSLLADDELRLSFCFMNKTMLVQHLWKQSGATDYFWRAFQIAFILTCIPGIADKTHKDRDICDVLWFPTGGGKTEAYLGLAILVIALRKRKAFKNIELGYGTAVLSRYTLRLLTVQQFRRTLSAVTASELLRVTNWTPTSCTMSEEYVWGLSRFSVGLWVGAKVTPNRISKDVRDANSAVTALIDGANQGEPAQVSTCPACNTILAVTDTTLDDNPSDLFFLVESKNGMPSQASLTYGDIIVSSYSSGIIHSDYYWIRLQISVANKIGENDFEDWWTKIVSKQLNDCIILSARACRPGYFIRQDLGSSIGSDFEIHCPKPDCPLNQVEWYELVHLVSGFGSTSAHPLFEISSRSGIRGTTKNYSFLRRLVLERGVKIPAYTCDDQIYHRLPSIVISTVDKFARLAYEPRASSLFGNVDTFDTANGFYRKGIPPHKLSTIIPDSVDVTPIFPPELIIQDELHLIEGPLGSMVGLYESAIEQLCKIELDNTVIKPKYVGSSATIRHADSQVQALFDRELRQFPPKGVSISDSFFSRDVVSHPVSSNNPGRIYLGVCAPGKGAQTPALRLWAVLMQQAFLESQDPHADKTEVDQFWTHVGFFNSLRELAIVRGLYRQDIKSRIESIANRSGFTPRITDETDAIELSSAMDSSKIPGALKQLARSPNNQIDAVLATAMFATGVDVSRLGLMTVHGQPKTTSTYIQATGRVGRKMGGLVITLYRAVRPRDLDHYEFFVGYHEQLLRYVEPITVHPFSPRALERAAGPVGVSILRNDLRTQNWAIENRTYSGSILMKDRRMVTEVKSVEDCICSRGDIQPTGVKPNQQSLKNTVASEIERWEIHAKMYPDLVYVEYITLEKPVVLGDLTHESAGLPVVYRNAPQSLRDIESTTRFG
jgi:hypothetical protein